MHSPGLISFMLLLGLTGCDKSFDRATATSIAKRVINGELLDELGVVQLPEESKWLTTTGDAYVTALSNGQTAVLFVAWRGKGKNMKAQLYYPASLTVPSVVELRSVEFGGTVRHDRLHDVFVDVEKKESANWYSVSYQLD